MRRNKWAIEQDTPQMIDGAEHWHTFKVAAKYDYSPEHIRYLFRTKRIKGVQKGNWLWIDIASFRDYLDSKGGIMRDPAWISITEAAQISHYATSTILKWIGSGKIEGRQGIDPDSHATVWHVKRDDIIAFADGRDKPIRLEGDLGATLWNTFGHLLGGKRGN